MQSTFKGSHMTFAEYAQEVESKPWPSIDADGLAKEALESLQSGKPLADYTREQRIQDMAHLLWYVTVLARAEGVALTSVADRSIAFLSRLPPNKAFGP